MNETRTRRVALFGGSFDPPHVAHQMVGLYTREVSGADAVWMMPCGDHPLGKSLTPFSHRAAMCRLAVQGVDEVEVSEVEESLSPPNRTLETVRHLQAQHPHTEFLLVVGADILKETDKWYGWDELIKRVEPFVVGRSGWERPAEEPAEKAAEKGDGEGGAKRAGSLEGAMLEFPRVSSSEVRKRLRLGHPVDTLVPRSVLGYIRENGLYS